MHRYAYDKTMALTERKTVTWIFLYCPFVILLCILNVYINLYHKLPPSYDLITYYQWAYSAVKSVMELFAEWHTFRIAPSTCCGSGCHPIKRKFFFIKISVQQYPHSVKSQTRYLQLYQDQAVFQQISAELCLLQVTFQWTALLLRVHIRMQVFAIV